MFLDDTACNLASLNLLQFRDPASKAFDVKAYEHAVRLWTLTLEISVAMAQFPSKEIARLSYDYRTLGLGYANIGGLLHVVGHRLRQRRRQGDLRRLDRDPHRPRLCGLGRDRRQERRLSPAMKPTPSPCCASSAITSARRMGRLPATSGSPSRRPRSTTMGSPRPDPPGRRLSGTARAAWRDALTLGESHGYRNAQVSVIAPTGTIGLVMDCDTTGIEPDFALVKFKQLAGGGYFKIINRAVPEALRALGDDEEQIGDIVGYAVGRRDAAHAPGVNHAALKAKGMPKEAIDKVEAALAGAFDIRFVFNKWTLGAETLKRRAQDPGRAL